MNFALTAMFKSFAVCFVTFCLLAFTPLNFLPMIFSLPIIMGWGGALLLLFLLGAPCAGYVFILITSPKGKRLKASGWLTGYWIGSTTGSWFGLKMAGEF